MNYELDHFYWYDNENFPNDIQLKTPSEYPCIILNLFEKWNDFGITNNFFAFYLKNENEPFIYLGKLKIISKHNDEQNYTLNIPNKFKHLPEDFISLGASYEYYENLRENFNEKSFDICNDLRDVAINEDLRKNYEHNYFWLHSILRDNESERMLRAAKDILKRYDYHLRHKFIYNYSYYKYGEINQCPVNFDFDVNNEIFPRRLYAIIGKNGVGKTTLIKNILRDYVNNKNEYFNDSLPKFSLPILVTTSSLDNYYFTEEEKKKIIHCSLLKNDNTPISEDEQIKIIIDNIDTINKFDYEDNPIVKNALEVITKLVKQDKNEIQIQENKNIKINTDKINEIYKTSSSGEKSLLFIMISILAHIRKDSLLIIDEPELHLHPNFIALFIYTIYKLLNEYSSYAIITTHSPIVIREMRADDVYIMEREKNECSFRPTKIETLGADLTEITDDVFNTREIPLHFIEIIEEMKNKSFTKEDIKKTIKSSEHELSLAVELYIESLFI